MLQKFPFRFPLTIFSPRKAHHQKTKMPPEITQNRLPDVKDYRPGGDCINSNFCSIFIDRQSKV